MNKKQYMHGFTLVELLVVIAIIALLLSILMPSLGKARKSVQSIVCRSNLKQLSMGMLLYSQNNNGKAPAFKIEAGNYWFFSIAPYLDSKQYVKDPAKALKSGMATMYCPTSKRLPKNTPPAYGTATSDWRTLPGSGKQAACAEGSFGLNLWLTPEFTDFAALFPTEKCWTNYSMVSGNVPIFGDSNWVGGWPAGDNYAPRDLSTGYIDADPGQQMGRWCIARHGKAVNMSFIDGHCETVRLFKLWDLKWYPSYKHTYNVPSWMQ
jgi:prepilin-type N-terminal cleavage/methylation domain-containing protein/prepilin-type processing-associated H-X9-DG protein